MPDAGGTAPAADVDAIVLAAGQGERLGLGPKALLALGGRTLLERAIAVMLAVARRVIAGVPESCLEECVARFGVTSDGRVLIIAGGATRMDTTLRLFRETTAPFVIQHDVVHPFVTEDLARRVLEAARRTGAALAAERSGAHVYRGGVTVAERVRRGDGLWVAQKPLAFARAAFARALDAGHAIPDGAGALGPVLASGHPVEIVAGEPWNTKISTTADWALAEVIDRALASGALGASSTAPSGGERR